MHKTLEYKSPRTVRLSWFARKMVAEVEGQLYEDTVSQFFKCVWLERGVCGCTTTTTCGLNVYIAFHSCMFVCLCICKKSRRDFMKDEWDFFLNFLLHIPACTKILWLLYQTNLQQKDTDSPFALCNLLLSLYSAWTNYSTSWFFWHYLRVRIYLHPSQTKWRLFFGSQDSWFLCLK